MSIRGIYVSILIFLGGVHVFVWAKEGRYSFGIFLCAFVALAMTINIYQYLNGKTMIMGKFDLSPNSENTGLRMFFFGLFLFFFVILYGAAIGLFPIT